MRSLNRVELIGHVGADPEIRTTKGGKQVASASLATNRRSGDQEWTDWHRLTFWGQLAALVESYVKKGAPLWVAGEIRYSTSSDGDTERHWVEIVVSDVIFLPQRSGSQRSAPAD